MSSMNSEGGCSLASILYSCSEKEKVHLDTLNLCNNSIYLVPSPLLHACRHVLLNGNPALDYCRMSRSLLNNSLRTWYRRAILTTPSNAASLDDILVQTMRHRPAPSGLDLPLPFLNLTPIQKWLPHADKKKKGRLDGPLVLDLDQAGWIPTLRELAMRSCSSLYPTAAATHLPWMLMNDMQGHTPCERCGQPFLNEWLTTIHVRPYQTYPFVVCKLAFCSTRCWRQHELAHPPPLPRRSSSTPTAPASPASTTPFTTLHPPLPAHLPPLMPPIDLASLSLNHHMPPPRMRPTRSTSSAAPNADPATNNAASASIPLPFEWIVAAADASAQQLHRDQSLG
ncbi:hypothetical protein DM01DRAFT_1398821 [Hesseltinella vesiculosa]|uniref:Uncharacterized protein n=1 Tax=Hesseltinella vesiculosa TaxID=101127 RepID=A0A1X2G3X2_9FUNG|nr:hypothetical protein DM01DRAFT_1398821 [Hesseltinella vesiculosa]